VTATEVFEFIKTQGVLQVDICFTDFLGLPHHVTFPIKGVDEHSLQVGFAVSGSAASGWAVGEFPNYEGWLLLVPDASTAFVDPFISCKTLVMTGNVVDCVTSQMLTFDPRGVTLRAEEYLKSSGVADLGLAATQFEYCVHRLGTAQDSLSLPRPPAPSTVNPYPDGVANAESPPDYYLRLRTDVARIMNGCGNDIESHFHVSGTAGQCGVVKSPETLTRAADSIVLCKYVIHNVAAQDGKRVTFRPDVESMNCVNGMHVRLSLLKQDQPLFAGDMYAGLSQLSLYYIGGLLRHARSLAAIVAPTPSSYRRLVPGYEAPVNVSYSRRERSAIVGVPMFRASPKMRWLEFRPPDLSSNPYLALAAIMMAGLDGVTNKIDPGESMDNEDVYGVSAEEIKPPPQLPTRLEEALGALEDDQVFLLKGDVFTEQMLEWYVSSKRAQAAE